LALWDCRFLAKQPFRKNAQPENAGYSGCDLLRREIATQELADFLEHLPHEQRSLPGIDTFNSRHNSLVYFASDLLFWMIFFRMRLTEVAAIVRSVCRIT
jgi:hypothetical protein